MFGTTIDFILFFIAITVAAAVITIAMLSSDIESATGYRYTHLQKMKEECEVLLPRHKQCVIYFKEEE